MPQQLYSEAILETALIVDVDMKNWSVTVGTQHSDRILENIPWTSPYLHPEGEGISFFPEVGSQCILCTPSDGDTSPFVLAFLPIPKKADNSSNRLKLRPGDISLTTRDENFVILRRGGVVQIGSGPISQRMYLPLQNLIRDIAQSYQMETFAGSCHWEVDDTPDEQGRTRVSLKIRDNAQDLSVTPVRVFVGDCPTDSISASKLKEAGGEAPIISVEMEYPEMGTFTFAVDRKGVVSVYSGSSLSLRVGDRVSLVAKSLRVETEEDIEMHASRDIIFSCTKSNESYQESIERGSKKTVDSPQISLGPSGSYYGAVKWEKLQEWLLSAKIIVVPTPSGLVGTFDPISLSTLIMLRSNSVSVGE